MPETLTIDIRDGGSKGGGSGGNPPAPQPYPLPPNGGGGGSSSPFNAIEAAGRQVEAERRKMLTQAAYLNRTQGPADIRTKGQEAEAVNLNRLTAVNARIAGEREKMLQKAMYENMTGGPADITAAAGGSSWAANAKAAGQAGVGIGGTVGRMSGAASMGAQGAEALAGAEGMAAAAGPVGMIIAAGMAVQKEIEESLRKPVQNVGETLTKVAALDVSAFGDAMDGAAKQIPVFGEAMAEGQKQTRAFVAALEQTARKFSEYNAELAVSTANADVRQILGDIRRASYLGNDLARFTDAKSKLADKGQDVLAAALKPLIPLVTRLLENSTKGIDKADQLNTTLANYLVDGYNLQADLFNKMLAKVDTLGVLGGLQLGQLKRVAENTALVDPSAGQFLDDLANQPGIEKPIMNPVRNNAQLNFPVVAGL